ncbi:MAG: type I secretion system permease/ATPase [Pseudomonadota bacterium]
MSTHVSDQQGGFSYRALAYAVSSASVFVGMPISVEAVLSGLTDGRAVEATENIEDVRQTLGRLGLLLEKVDTSTDSASLDGPYVGWVQSESGSAGSVGSVYSALLIEPRLAPGAAWRCKKFDAQGTASPFESAALPSCIGGLWRLDVPARVSEPELGSELAWLWSALRAEHRTYTSVALAALLINLFALAMPIFSMAVYDRIAPNSAYVTLWTLSIGVAIILVFDFVMRELRAYLIDVAARRVDVTVSRHIYEHLLSLALGNSKVAIGTTADRLRGFQAVQEFLASASVLILVDLPFVILFTAVLFIVGGYLGLVVLIMGPLAILTGLLLQAPMARAAKRMMIHGQERHGTLVETIGALEAVRTVGAERVLRRRWRDQVAAAAVSGAYMRLLGNRATNAAVFIQQVGSLLILLIGVYMIGAHTLTTGGLIAATMLAGRALAPFAQLTTLMVRAWHAKAAAQGLQQFMDMPLLRPAGSTYLSRPNLEPSLVLEDIEFAYGDYRATPQTPPIAVLSGINLSLRVGERVAIVGRIGSGKSTLLKIISGVYAPTKGAIRVGGVNLLQLDPAELRTHIGYVAQEPLLFSGTVRENIAVGWPEATDEAVVRAAQASGADEFLRAHPAGYQRQLGERGLGLSVGQRQAVAIAQALVRAPNFILLDEPSSAMDQGSETRFVQGLQRIAEGATLIVVTHKPSLLALVDRVVVMEAGRIVADGPKDQILARLFGGLRVDS